MKIIISHDVDHLYATDHRLRDLIFPKLIIRSILHWLQGKIKFKTVVFRFLSIFEKRLNRIDEIMEVDKKYGVPSVFFFGMRQGLGMSYKKEEAISTIKKVNNEGFGVGVHGISFEDKEEIRKEFEDFKEIVGNEQFGIRTHYVRFTEDTFMYMAESGYLFDTSQFNKQHLELKKPYKVKSMWEFPLHIMDGYIIPPGNLEKGKKNTIKAIERAEEQGMPYCTILYHDYQYNEKTYPAEKEWYDWLLDYIKEKGYQCISYKEAIVELEKKNV